MRAPVDIFLVALSQRDHRSGVVPASGGVSGDAPETIQLAEKLLTIPNRIALSPTRVEFVEAAATELRRLLGARVAVIWDGGADSFEQQDSTRFQLVIEEQKLRMATLDITRSTAFTVEERRLLTYLSTNLSYLMSVKATAVESRLMADLSSSLPASLTLEDAAQVAVDALLHHLEAQSAKLLQRTFSDFETLATAGEWPDGMDAVELARANLNNRGAAVCADGLLACPVRGDGNARYILLLMFPDDSPGVQAKLPSVQQVARALAPHLEARWRTFVLGELLKLHEASAETPTEVMYERILNTAVRLVPGADSGSLTTRASSQEPFVYQAVQGFDADTLLGKLTTAEEAQAWYGPDQEGWLHGRPREIRSDVIDIAAHGTATTPQLDVVVASYDIIQASVCLPVLHQGEVLAMLNVENQSDPAAFGRDALEVIQLFGAPLASLLHRQQLHDVLTHAALNDELTGLPNRRTHTTAINRAFARHQRNDRPLSLLSMDLKGFKQVNDTLGHDAGDDALKLVAQVLQHNLRDGDLLSRLGGDEFAALLSDTPAGEAAAVAERLRASIADLDFRGMHIRINIGIATAPEDGTSIQALSVRADRRMYQDKRGND